MKQCTHCKETKDYAEFRLESASEDGYYSYCRDCAVHYDQKSNATQMYVNGKYIHKTHPLHKPGRFKTLDDAWSHCEIDERSTAGEVYIIRNSAWTNWLKVGKAVSSEDRLQGYQTSSPLRDYVLEYCEQFDNRHEAESTIHRMLEKHDKCFERRGEWFRTYIPTIKEVMNEYRDSLRHRDQQDAQYDMVLCN